jgi:hypothetical protein
VQCSAVQCSAVQCSAVRFIEQSQYLQKYPEEAEVSIKLEPLNQCAVQCSAVQYSAVQCSAVQCSAVLTLPYS